MILAVIVLAVLAYVFAGCGALVQWAERHKHTPLDVVFCLVVWPLAWLADCLDVP